MKTFRILLLVCLWVGAGNTPAHAGPLSETDKQFLARYENIRSALAADDLAATKTAAGDLGEEGGGMAKSDSLKDARLAFEKLSEKAKQLAAGQSGYNLVYCPMLKKEWIQTSAKIENPYYGKRMLECGEIKK
jgi:hypothetical protein